MHNVSSKNFVNHTKYSTHIKSKDNTSIHNKSYGINKLNNTKPKVTSENINKCLNGKSVKEYAESRALSYTSDKIDEPKGLEIEFKTAILTPEKAATGPNGELEEQYSIHDKTVASSVGQVTCAGKTFAKITIQGECDAGKGGQEKCIEVVTGPLNPAEQKLCDKALKIFYTELKTFNGLLSDFLAQYNAKLPDQLKDYKMTVPPAFAKVHLGITGKPQPNYQTNTMEDFGNLHNMNVMKTVVGDGSSTSKTLTVASKAAISILGENSSDYLKSLLTMILFDSGNLIQQDCYRETENVDLLIRTTAEETICNLLSTEDITQLQTVLTNKSHEIKAAMIAIGGRVENAEITTQCNLNIDQLKNICGIKLAHPEFSVRHAGNFGGDYLSTTDGNDLLDEENNKISSFNPTAKETTELDNLEENFLTNQASIETKTKRFNELTEQIKNLNPNGCDLSKLPKATKKDIEEANQELIQLKKDITKLNNANKSIFNKGKILNRHTRRKLYFVNTNKGNGANPISIKNYPDVDFATFSSFKAKYYATRPITLDQNGHAHVILEQRSAKLPGNVEAKNNYLDQQKAMK